MAKVTRNPLKTGGGEGGELRCSGRVSSSCSTSGIRRVNLVTNPVISHIYYIHIEYIYYVVFFIIGHHSSFLINQSSYMNFHVESFILSFKNLSNLSFCDTVNQSFQPPTPPKIQQFSKLNEIYHFCQTSIGNMCIMYKIIVLQLDTRSLVLCVCFVDRCRSFCTFSFGHCVVCPSIYGF